MKVSEVVHSAIKNLFKPPVRLIEVEYVKRIDGMHLVVYIDKDGGVTLDDCVAVSRMIDPILDDLNPTGDESYCLDVSSYGLDKPLKYDWQFEKYHLKQVDVKLYRKIDGRKQFTATLIDRDNNRTLLEIGKDRFEILNSDIAYVMPHIDF